MSPNINDLNEFISPQDVKDGDVLTFTNEGEIEERDYSPNQDGSDVKPSLKIEVELPNGKKKLISPNKTSRTAIAEKYTPDTANWIGKSVKISLLKQNVRGKIRDVIYLEPVE